MACSSTARKGISLWPRERNERQSAPLFLLHLQHSAERPGWVEDLQRGGGVSLPVDRAPLAEGQAAIATARVRQANASTQPAPWEAIGEKDHAVAHSPGRRVRQHGGALGRLGRLIQQALKQQHVEAVGEVRVAVVLPLVLLALRRWKAH